MASWNDRTPVVGIVSPGHMGSGLGAALRRGGASVLTTLAGRSARSARLAAEAGLTVVESMAELVGRCDVMLSVVPPQDAVAAAEAVADAAAARGAAPVVADLNAVSPQTLTLVRQALDARGIELVDGAISGPPPSVSPGARVYLAGPAADAVAALPWTDVQPHVLGDEVGAASALKMCTASVYKGTTALIVHALLTARKHGVLAAARSQLAMDLDRDPLPSVLLAASKAWRYVPEMEEIAVTQRSAGLDPALFTAMAEIYRQLSRGGAAGVAPEEVDFTAELSAAVDTLFPPGGQADSSPPN